VIEYTGERVNLFESYLRSHASERLYSFWPDKFWRIDGASGGSGAEFVNHSCTPNLRTSRARAASFSKACGTSSPAKNYGLSKDAPKIPCRCGSPECRGTIDRI
jgi:uncharacterized protein